jgi:hypothetical protein
MMFRESFAVYCENKMKLMNGVCMQHAELLNVTAGGVHTTYLEKG